MKKADLLALIQALPDGADIQVEDFSMYDTYDISGIVPAAEYGNWIGREARNHAMQSGVWVLLLD